MTELKAKAEVQDIFLLLSGWSQSDFATAAASDDGERLLNSIVGACGRAMDREDTRALSPSPDRLRETQLEQREAVRRVGNLFHKTRLTHEVQVDPDDLYHVLVAAGYYNPAALATPNAQRSE